MCVTSSKSLLDNTYVGAWDINHSDYGYRHVLAYQNRVQSLVEVPNCMLLPIPSAEAIQPSWVVDTSKDANFLTDLYEVLDPEPPSGEDMHWMSRGSESINYVVEIGVYHIAILNDCSEDAVKATLTSIPRHKLPPIESELLDFFNTNYKGFPLLLCCFDNKDAQFASPILVHYPPKFPDILMVNTLDSHGGIPKISTMMNFHQKIVLGSYKNVNNANSKICKPIDCPFDVSFQEFLPQYACAIDLLYWFRAPNKDLCFSVSELHEDKVPKTSLRILGQEDTVIDVSTTSNDFALFLKSVPSAVELDRITTIPPFRGE